MRVKKRFFLFPFIVFTMANGLGADENAVKFQRISIEKGLSQSTVNCILQDQKGFLWFGTEDGLNKHDGYGFKIYRPLPQNPNSLSNNSIWALYEDRERNIWIGTYNGLNKFDTKTERFTRYLHDPKDPASLNHPHVRAVLEDRGGALWIGTDNGGVGRLDRSTGTFVRFQNDPRDPQSLSDNRVQALFEDKSGGMWVGTQNGLNRLDPKSGKCVRFHSQPRNPRSLSSNVVNVLFEDKEGVFWVGTADGLNRFDKPGNAFARFQSSADDQDSLSHNDVRAVYEDRAGRLWVGTDLGLNVFNRATAGFLRYRNDPDDAQSLSSDSVRAVFEDRAGSLWIGTFSGGISKVDSGTRKFVHYRKNPGAANSLSSDQVVSLCEDKNGILWIGTFGGGLNKFDRRTNRFSVYLHNPADRGSIASDRIRKIREDRSGALWIGTYGGGLDLLDPLKGTFSHYRNDPKDDSSLSDDRIRAICEDRSGILWIGTDGGGLNAFDRKSRKFTRFRNDPSDPGSLSHNRIFSILEDRLGRLWIATFGGGLEKFDPRDRRFVHYRNDPNRTDSISYNYVMCLHEDASGILWIGTDGGGLNKFDPEKETFRAYTEADGLPNNTIYGILEDRQGNLWMSHNKGLSRFDPKQELFKNYDKNDGLQGDEFNGNTCFKSPRTGEMFFGGVNGFNAFDPETIKDNPYLPPIVITDFQIFNQSVPVGPGRGGRVILDRSIEETEAIDLSYRDNVISFEYTALNFVSPEKSLYAYRMERFEKNWNYVGQRRYVSYTSLPPGKYVFRVKGSNSDGVWNENGAAIRIFIHPPFWKTWWFYLLAATAVGLGAFGVHNTRIRSLREKKKELENLVAQRTQELREMSLNDPLTGLRNRRYISEVFSNDIAAFINYKKYILTNKVNRRSEHIDQVFGIFILDIDHFKEVNDKYGHEAGDLLLTQFGKILKASVRQDDIIVRFGGEEFLIVLKKTDPNYLAAFAEKMRAKIETTPFPISADGKKQIQKTCSIGYVSFPFYAARPDLLKFEKTVMLADMGLYQAKAQGRNRAVGVNPTAVMPQSDQLEQLISSIDFALKNGFVTLL